MSHIDVTLTGLNTHPVKSCRAIALEEAHLAPRGLPFDREWMVVRPDGMFVTQRECPRLALVRTILTTESLELCTPGQPDLRIDLREVKPIPDRRSVAIWGTECRAFDEGGYAADWFGTLLGFESRLVRFDPEHRRLSKAEWTGGLDAANAFSDGFPLLVVSEESLADLNGRISGPALPMSRFRPNLVIAGGGAYAEDRITALVTDDLELRLVKPCTRCRITTTDQLTGEVGAEPLVTLAKYRRDEQLGGLIFGQNAIIARGWDQVLRVGMTLRAVLRSDA